MREQLKNGNQVYICWPSLFLDTYTSAAVWTQARRVKHFHIELIWTE